MGGRTELLVASMCFTIGSTIEAESAEITNSLAGMYVLFFGRVIYGTGIAFTLHSIPNYISEFSPPQMRGVLGGFIEVSMTIGIIYGYAIGQWLTYEFPYGYAWKYTFKFATIFGLLMFFGMLYLPESPRWLVSAGRPLYEALEAAQFINPDMTSENIVNLKKDIERQIPVTGESVTKRLFCSPALRIPMLVGVGLIVGQQLTGLPSILYYLVGIMKEVAGSGNDLMLALLSFAASKLFGSVVVMLYMDTWGRRTPLITGLVVMFLSSGTLFMLFYDSLQTNHGYTVGMIALLDLFVIGYEFSVGAITFVMLGEIFPGDLKGDAVSVAFIINFFLASVMTFLMYWEITDLGYSVVWCQLSATSFIFVFFATSLVPETKGKTLEEIQKEFQQEFDMPDFLAAVDYLSGAEGLSGTDMAGSASEAARAAASAASRGAAYLYSSGGESDREGPAGGGAALESTSLLSGAGGEPEEAI